MNKDPIKCDACGKFIPYIELQENGGGSSCFIPDSDFTIEENIFRCKQHTTASGIPQSNQSAVLVPFYGSKIH